MSSDIAVEFKSVFEKYEIEIKTEGKTFHDSFEALTDVSFSVNKGESLAIIGPNGAGKSTVLRLMAGLLSPEKGEVKVHGRVASLLDLGAGFHAELTGRDNLLLNASLYNFSREEFNAKLEQILNFADIGKFIDVPVRCYSQGMYVRLAFSLAIHVDPEILLIDDCLAVGDDNFRLKSLDKVLEFKEGNKTIIFVTHDFGSARQVCESALYLREGKIIKHGVIDEVVACYVQPLTLDKARYKYLSKKQSDDEALRRLSEENQRKMEEQRRSMEEENFRKEMVKRFKAEEADLRQKMIEEQEKEMARWSREEEARRKRESENWNQQEASRRKAETENWNQQESERRRAVIEKWSKKANHALNLELKECNKGDRCRLGNIGKVKPLMVLGGSALRCNIAPGCVRLFHHDAELTNSAGVQTIFFIDNMDISSSFATWKIRQRSKTEIVCFLKWPEPLNIFQVWLFTQLSDGVIDLEILARPKDLIRTANERIECGLKVPSSILDEERWGNKSRAFYLEKSGIKFETLDDDKVSGISRLGPYFLTVRDYAEVPPSSKAKKQLYFKGRFSYGTAQSVFSAGASPVQELKSGFLKILFREGALQLIWKQKVLTQGFGLYTSIYSGGIWYDSRQAKWAIEEHSSSKLIVRGTWPWLPIVQTWEIILDDQKETRKNIFFACHMKLSRKTQIDIQETALMLDDKYKNWCADKKVQEFSEEFTGDDFFRLCPWAALADGERSISALSEELPGVMFKPALMAGHRLLVENSAHINDIRCRLFHCLRVNKGGGVFFEVGKYEFFKGLIIINDKETL